jgi:hypothetical protein
VYGYIYHVYIYIYIYIYGCMIYDIWIYIIYIYIWMYDHMDERKDGRTDGLMEECGNG